MTQPTDQANPNVVTPVTAPEPTDSPVIPAPAPIIDHNDPSAPVDPANPPATDSVPSATNQLTWSDQSATPPVETPIPQPTVLPTEPTVSQSNQPLPTVDPLVKPAQTQTANQTTPSSVKVDSGQFEVRDPMDKFDNSPAGVPKNPNSNQT